MSGAAAPDRYALVGHPVDHSWSPFIHELFARETLQNMRYGLIDVAHAGFGGAVRAFFAEGGRGLNITVPHKQAAAALCDALTPRAAEAAAVNTLRPLASGGLQGDNTDGVGLVTDLERNLRLELAGRRILILGAGGATRGILAPLLARRPALVAIANRTLARAVALVHAFAGRGPLVACGYDGVERASFDLVINATSANLEGHAPPLPAATIGPATVCYDLAYARDATPFTRRARAQGAGFVHLGWGMLVEQAAEAFHVWRGIRPATREVLEALYVELGRQPGGASPDHSRP